jgi:hypothetical protein
LEKERSAAATAPEEAMVMILRLQKDTFALKIEQRQQRRTARWGTRVVTGEDGTGRESGGDSPRMRAARGVC